MSDGPDEDGSVRTPVAFDHHLRDAEGDELNVRLQGYQNVTNRYCTNLIPIQNIYPHEERIK